MEDVYTVGLRLVQALLHYKATMPLAVSFPSAQTPEWDTWGHPLNSEPEAEPSTHTQSTLPTSTWPTCPNSKATRNLLWLGDLGVCYATVADCYLPPTGCPCSGGEQREVYDLCSRTAVNLCSLFILSAFGEKEDHYTVAFERFYASHQRVSHYTFIDLNIHIYQQHLSTNAS